MCGFAALVQFGAPAADRAVVERMAAVLAHRGPDGEGSFFDGPVGLGFRRLAILDLTSSGDQPMATADGRYVIVFNGEIYNYVELRRELAGLGHSFLSTGDTETLLHAYAQWGSACLARLNGMWAFVIYDRVERKLFGSRDRFGIKPLYRYQSSGEAMFASEIKAITASGLYRHEINWKSAARMLVEDHLDLTSDTLYRGIYAVPAGAAFELHLDGRYREWLYWSLDARPAAEPANPAADFASSFEDAVRLHMRSDVPVGICLSGGLDSTSIACATARLRAAEGAAKPLMAFCYQAPEYDESAYIADTLRQSGAVLVNLETTPQALWDDLGVMMGFQDEPVHSLTSVIEYQLMRLAAQHGVKVVLGGQGADETIGGYTSYFRDYWHTLLSTGRVRETWSEIGEYTRVRGGDQRRLFAAQVRHTVQTMLRYLPAYRWAVSRAKQLLKPAPESWYNGSLLASFESFQWSHEMDLASVLRTATEVKPLPIYLRELDRASMAHSVEARVPFLDHRLVSLCFSMAPEWHLRGPWNKLVLREAMHGRIPESVRTRVDKMGFPYPSRRWLANELHAPVLDILHSRATRERGIYNLDVILRDAERHRKGEINAADQLLNVAQFEIWCGLVSARALRT